MGYGQNSPPIGSIIAFAGPIDPKTLTELEKNGWYPCTGEILNKSDYPDLAPIIGNNFGGTNSSFSVPDLRGLFIRGFAGVSNADPDKDIRIASGPGGVTGNKVGTLQQHSTGLPKGNPFVTSTDGNHTHTSDKIPVGEYDNAASLSTDHGYHQSGTFVTSEAGNHSHVSLFPGGDQKSGDLETRPKNAAMHFLIKCKDSPSVTGTYIPEGTIIMYCADVGSGPASALAPDWLPVEGQILKNAANTYPELWEYCIENNVIEPTDSTLKLPDLRGQFIRACVAQEQPGQANPDQTALPQTTPIAFDTTNPHLHTIYSGSELITSDKVAGHSNAYADKTTAVSPEGNHRHTINGGGDKESRPINIALDFLIRVKNSEVELEQSLNIVDSLIRKFCPVFYLHPQDSYRPSSVEWWFQRTKLTKNGTTLLKQVGSWQNVLNSKITLDDSCHFELLSDEYRIGNLSTAPVYVLTKSFIKDGSIKCYDISYWLFYPFNGNIFAGQRVAALLGGAAGGLALVGPLLPVVFGTAAVAATAAAVYIGEHPSIHMHEGDWEHITVRTTQDGELLAVMYNDHGDERWFYTDEINSPYGSNMHYALEGTRPVVYSAYNSHASYPFIGKFERKAGFANDHTARGYRLDALNPDSPGYVHLNPNGNVPEENSWVSFQGRWGRSADKPGPIIQWIGDTVSQEIVPITSGPRFNWLEEGDKEPNMNWDSSPEPVLVTNQKVEARRVLSVHSIDQHLYMFYQNDQGKCETILFDGLYWAIIPTDHSTMFTGCEDVEVFQLGAFSYAVGVRAGSLVFGIQQNSTKGNYALLPWTNSPVSIDRHIMDFNVVSPIGSTYYYSMDGLNSKHILVAFLRTVTGIEGTILTILDFDGQHWTDVSPGEWFSTPIDSGSPIDICVYDGTLLLAIRQPDKKTYFWSCVPNYATSGGLRNWRQIYVDSDNYSSVSMIAAKGSLIIAAIKNGGSGIETCTVPGNPNTTPWTMQELSKTTAPPETNVQLGCISTSENVFLFVPKTESGKQYLGYYEMPT